MNKQTEFMIMMMLDIASILVTGIQEYQQVMPAEIETRLKSIRDLHQKKTTVPQTQTITDQNAINKLIEEQKRLSALLGNKQDKNTKETLKS